MVEIDADGISPEKALRLQNGIRWATGDGWRRAAPFARWGVEGNTERYDEEIGRFLNYAAQLSSVVLWENELWATAQAGNEAFVRTSITQQEMDELLPGGAQLWLFRHPWPVEDGDNVWSDFELDGPASQIGFLVCKMRGKEESWPWAIGHGWIFQLYQPLEGLPPGDETVAALMPRFRVFSPYVAGEPITGKDANIIAGLKFLSSNLVRVSKARSSFSRQVQRYRVRKGNPVPDVSSVGVVELRRTVYRDRSDPKDRQHIDWQHQWIVRGHWRKQWFPGKEKHSPVFIQPYVKGPDDKPLKPPRESVYLVKR